MATHSEAASDHEQTAGNWRAGVVGGVAGALVMGALIVSMSTPTIAVAIPSLYALAPPPNVGVGMVVHAAHGAVLGVAFAAVVGLRESERVAETLGIGLAWGVLTWATLAALLMPVWLSAVGSPASPPFPNFAVPSLLWHAVYGLVLGGTYAAVRDRL